MEFRTFAIDGPVEVVPRKIEDDRGYFMDLFGLGEFVEQVGPVEFVQDNQSLSVHARTIRGIHFRAEPFAQGKLVRCVAGKVFDVAVELCSDSPDHGRWVAVTLTLEQGNLGHAFCSLEPNSVIHSRVINCYSAECDKGVAWDDPDIGIEWPEIADPSTLLDRQQPKLVDLPAYFAVKAS
jgi:dTDP-4-dehydrorhamnose 3,5-epimerase